MSVSITTQSEARKVYARSALCYLCGKPLPILDLGSQRVSPTGPDVDRDHVVPDSVFPPADRSNFPLLLKTHTACNRAHSPVDQKFSELFRLHWDPRPDMNLQRLQLDWQVDPSGRATHSMWRHDDLTAMVFDWIRGFHYALYGEFLPLASHRATLLPFRELRPDGTEPDLRQFVGFAGFLLRQRVLAHFDRIYAYNGRL